MFRNIVTRPHEPKTYFLLQNSPVFDYNNYMIVIKKKESNILIPSQSTTTISEYLMEEQAISGAVAEINGRYPEKGFAVNEICQELVYILSGNGTIITTSRKTSFTAGDVIFIDKNESFAWQGTFSMFMVTTPKFYPKQHVIR